MKKFFVYLGSIFLVLALISCSALNSNDSSSALAVQLPPKSARAATSEIPEWAEDIDYFIVEVASRDGKSYKEQNQSFQNDFEASKENEVAVANQKASWGSTVRFEELPAGWYTVKVLAKTESGETLGGNETDPVQVEEGRVTSVSISIKKYSNSSANDENADEQDGDSSSETDKTPSSDEDTTELTFDGTVSFNDETYETLSEALLAATKPPTSGVNTITLNGNIKENLLTSQEDSGEKQTPWLISQNLIIDLNENTLSWAKFTDNAEDDSETENPLFQVASGAKLLIKNGTITSESGVEHSNILLGTTGGTIALENVAIKNVNAPYILSINSSLDASGATENSGAFVLRLCDDKRLQGA